MKILIIKLSALGDVIHSLALANYLAKTIPNAQIHYVVAKLSSELLINNPIIKHVYILPNSKDRQFKDIYLKTLSQIRQVKYDAVIDMQGLLKSAILTGFSRAKLKIGFKHSREFAWCFYNHKVDCGDYFDINRSIIDINQDLGRYLLKTLQIPLPNETILDFPLPKPLFDNDFEIFDSKNIQVSDKLPKIGIITRTTWESKNYPTENFINLINYLNSKIKAQYFLIGANSDINFNQNILNNTNMHQNVYDLSGKTNLLELINLFNACDIVIGGDTGPMHLASALNRPKIIALYGASPKIRNGPIGKNSKVIALNLDCQPCFKTKCPIKTNECLVNLDYKIIGDEVINCL